MNDIFQTPKESIFYEDSRLYVALAYEPLTIGHTVVVWKEKIIDINKLNTEDYEYLMDVVGVARDTLREFYKTEKVYLMYLDEIGQVHWHLVPRYNEKGFNVLQHMPERIFDFNDVDSLRKIFTTLDNRMIIEK